MPDIKGEAMEPRPEEVDNPMGHSFQCGHSLNPNLQGKQPLTIQCGLGAKPPKVVANLSPSEDKGEENKSQFPVAESMRHPTTQGHAYMPPSSRVGRQKGTFFKGSVCGPRTGERERERERDITSVQPLEADEMT
jgi:hypothetical protein